MDNLLLIKTQEIVHLSLLEDENILDAINTFEKYQSNLKSYIESEKSLQNEILDEINSSVKIFIKKLNDLANNYIKQEDYNKAALCLSEVIHYWDKDVYCVMNYIICLYKLGQFDIEDEFLEYLNTLLTNNSNCIILKDLGKMYARINKIEKAVSCMEEYLKSITEDKITYEDYEIMGSYYNELYVHNKYDDMQNVFDSIDYLLKADDINPTSTSTTKKIAITSSLINNCQLGKIYWDKLFKLTPPKKDDLFEYSTFCLKNKMFDEFYKYFDFRFTKETKPLLLPYPKIEKPEWKGEDIFDKTLLVLYEQGFGDTFLTYGYSSRLTKLAKKVIFIVQDEIYPLLKNNEIGVEVLKYSITNIDVIDFDCYIPSMSIPAALKLDESNISVGSGYIKADNKLVKEFKEKYFNNNKFKVGIAYSGDKKQPLIHRNIPVKEFLPLKEKFDNIEIYSLVKEASDENKKALKTINAIDLSNELTDFSKTAALIENCDLIISSDNGILNLAGAMGKKTFGIFNWYYIFRWFDLTGEDVVWYKSVKPFVNTLMNDWQSSMTKVIEEIKNLQKI